MARIDPHSYFDPGQPITKTLSLKWAVDFAAKTLKGEAHLGFGEAVSGALDLDTDQLTIHSIQTRDGRPVPYELGETDAVLGRKLGLSLPKETTGLVIAYETSPEAVGLQWLNPGQTAGKRHPFLFSQCQPHHARSMVPLQDSPRVRLPYRAEVTVPEGLTAVMSAGSAGRTAGPEPGTATFLFEMPQPIPSYLLALSVGDLASKDLSPRSRIWAEPETVEAAAWEFAGIEDMIRTAEGLFGPYVWDRYDMLTLPPAFPYGGMENPRLTFLTPTLLAGDRSLVAVVAHELAHSWTGNLVTNATMNDFWLNEGFTVWAERRILEALKGKDYAAMAWAIGFSGLKEAFERFGEDSPFTRLQTDLWGIDPDSMYSEVPYEKGARFVALLENAVGRDRFDLFIRKYMDAFRFTSITTEEFLTFLDAELPGLSSRVDAKRWLYEPGLPDNAPVFQSADLDALQDLSAGWPEGERPTGAQMSQWSAEETLIYLQGLPRSLPMEDCNWLDAHLKLTARGNYEILVEWLTIAAGSDYEPAFARIREVLCTVGRMKFLRPIYNAMGKSPRTRALAADIYNLAKEGYHALSRRVVETVMETYPKE
jgi:leukotriene-A4 hydrolase